MKALRLLCLAALALPLPAAGRGPTTPEERARIVRLAQASMADPLGAAALKERAWFLRWQMEAPDAALDVDGALLAEVLDGVPEDGRPPLTFQFTLSASAFLVEHPGQAQDKLKLDLAGLEGLLAAYQSLLKQDPGSRAAGLDGFVALRDKGGLEARVREILARETKN